MSKNIKDMIIEIRGKKVVLVSDLAKLLEMETKNVNRATKRNIDLFSKKDYFQLTKFKYEEISSRCQFGTLNDKEMGRGSNIKYLPYVFSKEGIFNLKLIFKTKENLEKLDLILAMFEEENRQEILVKSPELQEENIRTMIYEVKGVQVMMDEDLAFLYKCKNGTKEINQAVKNNIEKFPERYSWVLSDEEFLNLRSKFLTSSWDSYGGRRYNPRVFTEAGVYMLATILKTEVATEVSMAIIDTFTFMRKYVANNFLEQRYINNLVLEHDSSIKLLQKTFNEFEDKKVNNEIYFDGQVYDAYSKIVDIMKEAKNKLVVIDNYADKSVLDMISRIKVKVILIVKSNSLLNELDIKKYNKQYNNLTVIYNDTFHDRYIIIDDCKVFHLGASINHGGSKTFSINLLSDESIIKLLVKKVDIIIDENKK